ncbi:MAG: hypothetical protein RLZZ450_1422 [Pseudomonadota bacterium]|jgi:hypothetical protein
MREDIVTAFRWQAQSSTNLGSPFHALLLELLADRLGDPEPQATRVVQRVASWSDRAVADALALRLVGGLHALVRAGRAPELARLYPPTVPTTSELWPEVLRVLQTHDDFLYDFLDSPPQTNEVGRSSILLGGALLIAARFGLPLRWHEIGASAGLNLQLDRYRYELDGRSWGDPTSPVVIRSPWTGRAPDLTVPLSIVSREGCDVAPLDPSTASARERILSYVWPDQTERLSRTKAALELAGAASTRVQREPASTFVERHFAAPAEAGVVRVLVHSIVWQYLPKSERDAVRQVLARAGAAASERAPVAWFRMEADGAPTGSQNRGAALTLTTWPSGEEKEVGRGDFHGRWAHWAEA